MTQAPDDLGRPMAPASVTGWRYLLIFPLAAVGSAIAGFAAIMLLRALLNVAMQDRAFSIALSITLAALGIHLTLMAVRRARRSEGGKGTSLMLALMIVLGGGYGATALAWPNSKPHPGASRAACQNNLKQWGLVFRMYAADLGNGFLPPLSREPGRLMFENRSGNLPPMDREINPGILELFYCPAANLTAPFESLTAEEAFDDRAYVYLGYFIAGQDELEGFAKAYRTAIAGGGSFDDNLTAGSTTLHRLRLTDPSEQPGNRPDNITDHATVPILIERFPNGHAPDGGNVLYADGHVEFIEWGRKWPMTPEAMDVLLALDALGGDSPSTE